MAIITPYPPDRSGVAQYSEQTVAALSKLAVVDVFTDAPAPPPSPFVRRFAPITELPYVAPGWDRTLSVVGNSSFHVRMLEMLERHGGPCLVHDNRLAELYHWWRGPVGFAAQASRWLGRPVSIAEAEAWVREPGTLPSIFFHDVVRQAAPLLVHSRGIQARVREEYGVDAIALPFCVYRTFAEDELSDAARRAAAERLGLPRDRCSIVTLGMVAHTKGPLQCVEATRELLDQGVPADLYFVGPDEFFREPILARAAGLRITERVHLTGSWVSDRQYRDFVIAADLAIQLRSHGFGGLSGALQDCIAAGLPTVANRDLADAGDSPSYVMRVPDALSPGPIAASLAEAWKRGAHRTRLSEERRRYVEEHGFDVYARRLLAALELA
ncbi:MAG TPA: glycosyltransferase [Planctomycetota bacterium]|nr:glycosyltransferase [Planctomycetota bacterium]